LSSLNKRPKTVWSIIEAKVHAWKGNAEGSRKVFVIGTGRSGTHLLGKTILSHQDVAGTVEKPRIFQNVTEAALYPNRRPQLLRQLVRAYRFEHSRVAPKHYCDKSHPNLWIAEDLAQAFPHSLFVGINRNPYAVVASMLIHPGVRRWHLEWRQFPVPNAFLGISEDLSSGYDNLPLAEKCTLRWISHEREMRRLQAALGERLLVVNYENLILNTQNQLTELQVFLGLATPIPGCEIRSDTIDKWKKNLSDSEVETVSRVLIKHGFAEAALAGVHGTQGE